MTCVLNEAMIHGIPDEWCIITITPTFKHKEDHWNVKTSELYILNHQLKRWERVGQSNRKQKTGEIMRY